ncbi:SET and MYND domain-containing protein DDB_G0284059-like [Leptopilina boulardi]|uniref:SET and MYND domain-containing protein DDB_G0284059-like n=1 Tax=Leptopilina boulardi TaxID=63433 RepID=UPI0021F51DA1|nr:SET and MYND domain-containing protein DDB_G0284059-like [Leptopilina boulardi]
MEAFSSLFSEDFLLEKLIEQLYFNESDPSVRFLMGLFNDLNKNNDSIKNEDKSIEEFTKGKQALNKNHNKEALSLFNKALITAPGSSKHIVSFYTQRSIALQKLKAYSESLNDIERALKLSKTEEEKLELQKRKKIINSLILSSDLKNLNVTEKLFNENNEEISYGESDELIGVSSAISLKFNEKYGRHYIANQEIKVGDVLMLQKPFVHTLIPERLSEIFGTAEQLFCDYCLKLILNPIPCENCTSVIYCTDECKLKSFQKLHDIECQVSRKYPSNGRSLALRSLILATDKGKNFHEIYNIMKKIENCKDRTSGFHNGKLDGSKAEAILSLLTHTDKRMDRMHYFNVALVVNVLRKNTDFLKGHATHENTVKIGNMLLKFSYICQMNVYGIQGKNSRSRIALAIYPVFNYLNNSCANNALWYDKKNEKILRACKNIQKGEQVCVSYMTHEVVNKTAEERKTFFRTAKFFNCECEACKMNYNFKCELKTRLKIPRQLKTKLINKPNDTKSLWELLKLVVNEYKGPCLEGKRIEFAIVNAHLGSSNEEVPQILRLLRLL